MKTLRNVKNNAFHYFYAVIFLRTFVLVTLFS